MSDLWAIVDSRTNKRVTVAAFLSEGGALREIDEWRERDAHGGRPDCHDMMPFLKPKQMSQLFR